MNTQFVGIKEFRAHISDYAERARTENKRFVVMNRSKPLFEVRAFAEDETLDTFVAQITKAEQDVRAGKFYTQDEILRELA